MFGFWRKYFPMKRDPLVTAELANQTSSCKHFSSTWIKPNIKVTQRLRHTAQSTHTTHRTTPVLIFSKTTGFLRVFSDAVMIRSSAGPQLLSLLPKINFENISSKNKLMAALKLVFHYRTVSQPWSGGAGGRGRCLRVLDCCGWRGRGAVLITAGTLLLPGPWTLDTPPPIGQIICF